MEFDQLPEVTMFLCSTLIETSPLGTQCPEKDKCVGCAHCRITKQ